MGDYIQLEQKIRVAGEFDLCVLGGSCTGLFAAVRAARMGLKVCIVEMTNCFGGVATNGLVTIWHQLEDRKNKTTIIKGLTQEVLTRLGKRDQVERINSKEGRHHFLNTEELKIELDELAREHNLTIFFHSMYSGVEISGHLIKHIVISTKSGPLAVSAKFYIDSTGDGDLLRDLDVPSFVSGSMQPPSPGAKMVGMKELGSKVRDLIFEHGSEVGLTRDWGWSSLIPGLKDVTFHVDTHIFHADCSTDSGLTQATIEGRRHIRAIMDLVRKYYPEHKIGLVDTFSYLGVRETRHFRCKKRITEDDLLTGRTYPDAIAYGTYPVDRHHSDKPGITFKYLNGEQRTCCDGMPDAVSRWLPEGVEGPDFYQVPYGVLLPETQFHNVLCAGRMLDCDEGAFGALRVMVNLNQMGEAAGVAVGTAVQKKCSLDEVFQHGMKDSLDL